MRLKASLIDINLVPRLQRGNALLWAAASMLNLVCQSLHVGVPTLCVGTSIEYGVSRDKFANKIIVSN